MVLKPKIRDNFASNVTLDKHYQMITPIKQRKSGNPSMNALGY